MKAESLEIEERTYRKSRGSIRIDSSSINADDLRRWTIEFRMESAHRLDKHRTLVREKVTMA